MVVSMRLVGYLALQAGEKPGEQLRFELPEGATLAELFDRFDGQVGQKMPGNIWDPSKKRFHPSVMIMVDNQVTRDGTVRLREGSSVMAMLPMAGG
jgi:molybdopterin converting factor small subunit